MRKGLMALLTILLISVCLTGCGNEGKNEKVDEENNVGNVFDYKEITRTINSYYKKCKKENYEYIDCESQAIHISEPSGTWIIKGVVSEYNEYDSNSDLHLYDSDESYNYNIHLYAFKSSDTYEEQNAILMSYNEGDEVNLKCKYSNTQVYNIDDNKSGHSPIYSYGFYGCEEISE